MLKVFASRILRREEGMNDYRLVEFLQTSQPRQEGFSTMIWPLIAYFAFVVFLVTAVLVASYLLGQRHSEPATGEPYEGGIVSERSAHVRFSIADVKKEPRNKMPHEMKGKKISIPWDVRFV